MSNNDDLHVDKPNSKNDNKRLQSYISYSVLAGISGFDLKHVLVQHGLWAESHEIVEEGSFLLTLPLALNQRWHADFSFRLSPFLGDSTSVPLSVIVALDDTHIRVSPGAIKGAMLSPEYLPDPTYLPLSRGDVIVFRGDLIHSGAFSLGNSESVRLHLVVHMPSQGMVFDPVHTHRPPYGPSA